MKRISPMTVSEVLALLNAERDERGISNWEKLGSSTAGMRSYGIGLTRLRKLAKRIGRNRELAHALWKTDVYEARVIALLVDDPARITRDQAEKQVEELAGGMLAYVFASCDATLAKTSFVVELADQWVRSDDPVRRDCGYGLLYEASKFSGKKAPSEELFLAHRLGVRQVAGGRASAVAGSPGYRSGRRWRDESLFVRRYRAWTSRERGVDSRGSDPGRRARDRADRGAGRSRHGVPRERQGRARSARARDRSGQADGCGATSAVRVGRRGGAARWRPRSRRHHWRGTLLPRTRRHPPRARRRRARRAIGRRADRGKSRQPRGRSPLFHDRCQAIRERRVSQ